MSGDYSVNQTTNLREQAEAIRHRTIRMMVGLTRRAKELELPAPPDGWEALRMKLEDNTYQLLVIGEAKRGKSTFINALIGQELLPTDVDIATCQVFRICPAEKLAFRLRFEDGSQQAIKADELPRYGSQVLADADEMPRLDQIIRWIEVDVPVSFLPSNLQILDTPGLGSLYASHSEITYRFLPHADGVIFVLDSQAPISKPELQHVDHILSLTRNVFFIQTKIDQFRKEHWQEVQKRNEEALRQQFGDRLDSHRVWPISSKNLLKAAQTGEEDYLLVSRHQQLAEALNRFLFRVLGWSRAARAVIEADRYQTQGRVVLVQRLNQLLEESREKRAELMRLKSERQQRFSAEWGEQGHKRNNLLNEIHRITKIGQLEMKQALLPGGKIETHYRGIIQQQDSLDNIRNLAESLPAKVTEYACQIWHEICKHAQDQCVKALVPFLTAADSLLTTPETDLSDQPTQAAHCLSLDENEIDRWLSRIRLSLSHSTTLSTAVGLGHLALYITGLLSTAFFPLTILGAGAIGLALGWKSAAQKELKAAKLELSKRLTELISEVNRRFFSPDLKSGRFSIVEEYFQSLERICAERVNSIADQKLNELQAEIDRYSELSRLDEQQRQTRIQKLREQLAEWNGFSQEILALSRELRELELITP